jgi:short-subunit dehydrogenase
MALSSRVPYVSVHMGIEYTGSRVLLTGASSGIGAGLAEEFAHRGSVLALSGRDAERLAATAEVCRAHGATVHELTADLGDPTAVDRLAADALTALGGVDVLVNNAGIPKRRHTRDLDAATVDTVMQVNFLGPTRLTLALLPQMHERGAGRNVNVSSVAATLSSPGESAYDASKAALSVFSEAMAIDLWDDGIKVLVVYPGVVDTPLFTQPDNDPFTAPVEFITVGELVQETFAALDRDALEVYIPAYFKDYVTGKANNVEGFVTGTAEYMRQQAAGSTT